MSEQLQDLVLSLKTVGLRKGAGQVDALTASLTAMNTAVKGSTVGLGAKKKVLRDTTGKTAAYGGAAGAAAKETERLRRQVASLTGRGRTGFLGLNDTLDKTIRKVALWTISTAAVFGTLRALKAGITVITEHDTQMTGLRKVYSGIESDLAMIERSVMDTARAMQSLHDSAFEAAVTVARTGRTGIDVIQLTSSALVAQNIAELEAADAVKFLNSALIQFNENTDQAIRVLDEWNELSNRTPATTKDLAMAVSVAGSVFEQAGASIQFLNASTAALVEITAKSGNIIGRAERTMAIFSQRVKSQILLARLGIQVFNEFNEFIGIDTLLTQVAAKWEGLTDKMRAAIAQAIAGTKQQQFFIALMENQELVLRNLVIQWDSFGSAMKENEMFLLSISKRVDGLVNALERLAIGLGDAGIKAIIIGVIETLTAMVNAINDANAAMFAAASTTALLAANFAILHASMGVFGAISIAIGAFVVALTVMNELMNTNVRLMREQEEALRNSARALGQEQSRLESIISTIEDLQSARENLGVEESASQKMREREQIILDGLRNVYPELASEISGLGDAYDIMSKKLFEANKQLATQRTLLLELEMDKLRDQLGVAVAKVGIPGFGAMPPGEQAELVRARLDLLKKLEAGPGRISYSREDLMRTLTILNEIAAKQAEIAAIAVMAPGDVGGAGRRGPGGAAVIPEEARLEIQLKFLDLILAGHREIDIIRMQQKILEDEINAGYLVGVDLLRVQLKLKQLLIREMQIELRLGQRIGSTIGAAIASSIASGFEGDDVNRAMNNMVRRLGAILAETVSEEITSGLKLAGASNLTAGIFGPIAGGVVAGVAGLLANILFPRDEVDETTEAIEENTFQLRELTASIRDLTQFMINAPATFTTPAASTQPLGSFNQPFGGGGNGGITNDNRQTVFKISVSQQPGENGSVLARRISEEIADQFAVGGELPGNY